MSVCPPHPLPQDGGAAAGKVDITARCAAVLLLWLCASKKGYFDEIISEIEPIWFANCSDSIARFTLLTVVPHARPDKGMFSSMKTRN